jgi:hypothetical protein
LDENVVLLSGLSNMGRNLALRLAGVVVRRLDELENMAGDTA